MGDAGEPLHLLGELVRIAAVPAVGEDDDVGTASEAAHSPLAVERLQPVAETGAAGPVGDGVGGAGQGEIGVVARQLPRHPGEPACRA